MVSCVAKMTYKLRDVLKASANVRRCEQEGAPPHIISEFEQLLQVNKPAIPAKTNANSFAL